MQLDKVIIDDGFEMENGMLPYISEGNFVNFSLFESVQLIVQSNL